MTDTTTVVPTAVPPITGWRKAVLPAFVACVRASLRVSPRPMAFLIRRQFARARALTQAELGRHAPTGIASFRDERYGDGPDALLDVYVPETAQSHGERLPVIVWIHGGGWIGGNKDELAGYMQLLASHGFVAVAINYSLAPAARYPTPVRQTMAALRFVADNAARFSVDPNRVFLAGDSAGAQIAAQVAALVTNPAYVRAVGVAPTIDPARLRGVALCCGPYDPALADDAAPFHGFLTTILWSYSGTRDWRSSRSFSNIAIGNHLTADFPPTFITVGNADPLAEHSTRLAAALTAHGVEVDALFFPDGHQPPLLHEYQFRLDGPDAQYALARLVAFFEGHE
jgi:acetyl esterase/lipase